MLLAQKAKEHTVTESLSIDHKIKIKYVKYLFRFLNHVCAY